MDIEKLDGKVREAFERVSDYVRNDKCFAEGSGHLCFLEDLETLLRVALSAERGETPDWPSAPVVDSYTGEERNAETPEDVRDWSKEDVQGEAKREMMRITGANDVLARVYVDCLTPILTRQLRKRVEDARVILDRHAGAGGGELREAINDALHALGGTP